MLSTDQLAEIVQEPASKIRVWQTRGILQPESRSGWSLAEALGVAIYCDLLRDRRTVEETAAEAAGMVQAMGQFATAVLKAPETVAGASRMVFLRAQLADGERWDRLALTTTDLETLLKACLRRGVVRLELRDVTDLYTGVLEAFRTVRASRSRVLA